jgi:prefoldin alpha subunit
MAAEDIAQLRYLQELYMERYETISHEIKRRMEYMQELNNVSATLDGTDSISGRRVLYPIGADFYIGATAEKEQKCIVGVGAGYLLEKGVDEAKEFAARLLKSGEESLSELMKEKEVIENAMLEISYKIGSAEQQE